MARVYIGDVGEIPPPQAPFETELKFDLSKVTFRDLCNLTTILGFDVRDIIGINDCFEHRNMIFLGDKEMPEGFNLFEHCVYCKNCWKLFRWDKV